MDPPIAALIGGLDLYTMQNITLLWMVLFSNEFSLDTSYMQSRVSSFVTSEHSSSILHCQLALLAGATVEFVDQSERERINVNLKLHGSA
ncbi:hypothetical protein OROMI_020673 [Orobanche minor]